jgi:hypothetical protein
MIKQDSSVATAMDLLLAATPSLLSSAATGKYMSLAPSGQVNIGPSLPGSVWAGYTEFNSALGFYCFLVQVTSATHVDACRTHRVGGN